mmetsp:Transcript_48009/g.94256  ORF Transcript_48009/g.94256 Transcript_48009/m.94256 type:complete len:347 (-) Transcript_48009:517-1557(-)
MNRRPASAWGTTYDRHFTTHTQNRRKRHPKSKLLQHSGPSSRPNSAAVAMRHSASSSKVGLSRNGNKSASHQRSSPSLLPYQYDKLQKAMKNNENFRINTQAAARKARPFSAAAVLRPNRRDTGGDMVSIMYGSSQPYYSEEPRKKEPVASITATSDLHVNDLLNYGGEQSHIAPKRFDPFYNARRQLEVDKQDPAYHHKMFPKRKTKRRPFNKVHWSDISVGEAINPEAKMLPDMEVTVKFGHKVSAADFRRTDALPVSALMRDASSFNTVTMQPASNSSPNNGGRSLLQADPSYTPLQKLKPPPPVRHMVIRLLVRLVSSFVFFSFFSRARFVCVDSVPCCVVV